MRYHAVAFATHPPLVLRCTAGYGRLYGQVTVSPGVRQTFEVACGAGSADPHNSDHTCRQEPVKQNFIYFYKQYLSY
jgi:hypothetical protein